MIALFRHVLVLGLVVSSLTLTSPARADDASEAQLNFELGQSYYGQGRYLEALERFLTSYRLVENASVAFNIAQVYVLLDRSLDAYNWFETAIRLEPAPETVALATTARDGLADDVAVVEITSTPAGAEIFVDRVELGAWGRAPRRVAVEAGARTVILRLDGHHDASVAVTATRGTIVPTALELVPITGTVAVTTSPPGARIVRDDTGEVLGVSPLVVELPVGERRLRAVVTGMVESTATVVVVEGERHEVELRLSHEASTVATLSITGTEGARITLRGEALGAVPFTRADLEPGIAPLEVSADGLDTFRASLLLEAGSATRVAVELRPPPSWDWPIWRAVLYGGAGLLVASGAVVGGLALAQRDAFYASPSRTALDGIMPLALTSDVLVGAGIVLGISTLIADLVSSPPSSSSAEIEIER